MTALTDVLPREAVLEPQGRFLADLMGRGVQGHADAVVLPSTVDEVVAVLRWCYENDVPLTARGGGTGLAGGAIPVDGGAPFATGEATARTPTRPATTASTAIFM